MGEGGSRLGRPGAWGPGPPQGLGGPGTDQFFVVVLKSLLVGGWRRGGSQLKRLPQMWGPGGKRARDSGRKEEGFHPLSVHPTRPPRSADFFILLAVDKRKDGDFPFVLPDKRELGGAHWGTTRSQASPCLGPIPILVGRYTLREAGLVTG